MEEKGKWKKKESVKKGKWKKKERGEKRHHEKCVSESGQGLD